MNRFLKSFRSLGVVGLIGTYPKTAAAIGLMGFFGAVSAANFTPPTLLPQASIQFSQANPGGIAANVIKPNNGVNSGSVGPFIQPSTAQNSWAILWKSQINAVMPYSTFGTEFVASVGSYTINANPGLPAFNYQRFRAGIFQGSQWWTNSSPPLTGQSGGTATVTSAGSGYNTGIYPWVASCTGTCTRPMSGVWYGTTTTTQTLDPGFGYSTSPTIDATAIPLSGARQPTGLAATPPLAATSCVPNSPVSGVNHTVTANLTYAHGIGAGQTYTLQGFGASFTGYNATYTATAATTATTLVGFTATGGASCPTTPVTAGNEGTALSGTGLAFTVQPMSTTAPFTAGVTGITTKNNQRACYAVGEYGADNALFPGAAFITAVDDKGVALQGAPAEPLWLNQGSANFTGWAATGNVLNVTSMNSFAIDASPAATFSGGKLNFTTVVGGTPGLIPGSEFTVSGLTNTGTANLNGTYVAVTPTTTTATGTSITGIPLSGPAGHPQAITGTIGTVGSSSASLVGVIMPGMSILGSTPLAMIDPYLANSTTGTGGIGTYSLAATLTSTLGGGAGPGTNLFAWPSHYYTATATGTPLTPPGATTASVGQSGDGDLFPLIGAAAASFGKTVGFGGAYSDWAMLYGSFPQNADGTPATTGTNSLASLCTRAVDLPAFAATNSMTVHSRYELNDLGVLGDSSIANATGSVTTGGALTITAGAPGVAWANGLFVSGNGLCTNGCPTITGNSGVASYTLSKTYANAITSEPVKIGTFNQAAPFAAANWKGYIDNATPPLLHVTNLDISGAGTGAGYAKFTGNLSLGFTGNISPGSGPFSITQTSNQMVVTGLASNGVLQVGSAIVAPTMPAGMVITSLSPSGTLGGNGTYTVSVFQSVGATTVTNGGAIGQSVLSVTSPFLDQGNNSVGTGSIVNAAPTLSAIAQSTVLNSVTEGTNGQSNAYLVTSANMSQVVPSESLRATGPIPGPPNTLDVSSVTGTISAGMSVTDGGVSLGQPLLITAGSGSSWTVAGNYYGPIANDTTMIGSATNLVPGSSFTSATMGYPVKIGPMNGAPNWTPCGITGAYNGGLGCYTISNNLNGPIGSSGSPVIFTGTSISEGGPIAPGPALTIRDPGPGRTYQATRGTTTGTLKISGTYDVPTLGGTPTSIQAQVSLSAVGANGLAPGDPIPGCAACTWTALSSSTIAGGNWSGSALNIPEGGPYYVSVRPSNATSTYATMPNSINVGQVWAIMGEGQTNGLFNGGYTAYSSGLLGQIRGQVSTTPCCYAFPLNSPVPGTQGVVDYRPGASINRVTDRIGVQGNAAPFSEGVITFDQPLATANNAPVSFMDLTRPSTGTWNAALGGNLQTQTIAKADGVTKAWCSSTIYCANAGLGGTLVFNWAVLTGANFTGSVGAVGTGTDHQLTVNTLLSGALEPGMVVSLPVTGSGFSSNPTLLACLTNCTGVNGNSSTWQLDIAPCTVACSSIVMFADPNGPGQAPWHYFNAQGGGLPLFITVTFAIRPGSFSIYDRTTGTVLCTDTQTAVYNVTSGNCTSPGGSPYTIDASKTFVNYIDQTYEVAWTTPPANGDILEAQFIMNCTSTNYTQPSNRPIQTDWVGDGTALGTGFVQSQMANAPTGVAGYIWAALGGTEKTWVVNLISGTGVSTYGYQFGAPGYAQQNAWIWGTKYPTLTTGTSAAIFATTGQYRDLDPSSMILGNAFSYAENDTLTQFTMDTTTKSQFTGTINAASTPPTLTLTASTTDPMWSGEVIACQTVTVSCPMMLGISGVYIVGLQSGSWGASGSVYVLGGAPVSVTAQTLYNAVQSTMANTLFLGPMNDLGNEVNSALASTTTGQPHAVAAANTFRKSSSRWAAMIWGNDPNNPNPATEPQLDRVKASIPGCDAAAIAAPCFDIGSGGGAHYPASHVVTWTTAGLFTVTGGISPHDRPFVVGQSVTCSPTPCGSGLFITALSVPPTESTATGAGEVNQTFQFQTAFASGGAFPSGASSGTQTATAGCTGTSGTGASCIDIAVAINNTGTFGTAAAIGTCGVNLAAGNAENFTIPKGLCSDPGIGAIARGFRIGSGASPIALTPNSTFDEGIDPSTGGFIQSSAYTCHIVAAKIVQCVKGPVYAAGLPISVGQWNSFNQVSVTVTSLTAPSGGFSTMNVSPAPAKLLYVGEQIFLAGHNASPVYITSIGSTGGGAGAYTVSNVNPGSGSGTAVALQGTFIDYGSLTTENSRVGTLMGYVGGQSFLPIGTSGGSGYNSSGNPNFVATNVAAACPIIASGGHTPLFDITVSSGVIVNIQPAAISSSSTPAFGLGIGVSAAPPVACTLTPTMGGGSGVVINLNAQPFEGVGGIGTYSSDTNHMGTYIFDNSGEPGNPFHVNFQDSSGAGYLEPGLPLRSFGFFQSEAVSG